MTDQPTYVKRALEEDVAIVDYDPDWPRRFEEEEARLRACLPKGLIGRIEHFGSTAVPHLAAKPVIDMLVEVTSLEAVRDVIAPLLQSQGYEFFWRPTFVGNNDIGYAWFIKRDSHGKRTHHIHMLERGPGYGDRLYFRDYLIEHPEVAQEYAALKWRIADEYAHDRKAYARVKAEFIERVTKEAKRHY